MGHIRPLEERDIGYVVDLHRRVLPIPAGTAPAPGDPLLSSTHFKQIFFDTPWSDGQPSLVYEDDNGTPVGFLGVMPRRMILHGRPVRAVITSHFIVEPSRRATLAGIELIKALLAGSHDLTMADEAGDVSRKLWEGLGGTIALLYSLSWVRLFRPAEFAAARWITGARRAARARISLSRLADMVVTRSLDGRFRPRQPATRGEDLDGDTLAKCIADFGRGRALRPEYDGRAAAWLLEILARKPGCGRFRSVLVRTATGEIAGWYLYYGQRGGVGEVLQVGAREGRIGDVLDHLFAEAWHDGIVALVGKIDPQLMEGFSSRRCFFHNWGRWTLVHAKDPGLIEAIHRGDAFLTRLEGEWCARF